MSVSNETVAALMETANAFSAFQSTSDNIWMLVTGFLVFWMHAGFAMLECGSVQHKNSVNICFKNLGTVCISAVMYYLIGYAFAYGGDGTYFDDNGDYVSQEGFQAFIGSGTYALKGAETSSMAFFFFQFAFCATGATIVSGAVAGRINLIAYFLIAVYMTGFVYPIVSHWIWSSNGWISGFKYADKFLDACGMIDFAGSGVVHMTGGMSALVFAKVLGPRIGRFDADGVPQVIPPHNIALQTLGVFILWFGWYGFNCGSTLVWDGDAAGHVAVTTTLAPACAVITTMVFQRIRTGVFDIEAALNGALAGLVGITAPCRVAPAWGAVLIGIIAGFVYLGSSKLVVSVLKIDDPVDAIAVHGFCGIWGVLAAAIFADKETAFSSYCPEDVPFNRGVQFGTQVIGVFAIAGWCFLTCLPLAILLKVVGILRVSEAAEEAGLDASEHGAVAYVGDKNAKLAPA
mmetsp:Transcript_622/g.1156  ORF Transcript_622/g.1156 Transcript_622/m.1156 type:complete len:460 (-) Transcript_622:160-1539(-)|eukprot:CAMPEP_0171502910 /NCGR_PEP_ID=MMETSP0958-20121227/10504_1 /TAXON_ID=87120 /ORGANISM="Aurantiochytrium limacinum, Strain ATCCMYA-1381" /LENGTH=459 /DNA_ID=CAMNT_0012038145 /DNA_START=52 /DNA_END=1431 /DNA_ORIENTATION=+